MTTVDILFDFIKTGEKEKFLDYISKLEDIENSYLGIIKILISKFKDNGDYDINLYSFIEIFEKIIGNNIQIFLRLILEDFEIEELRCLTRTSKNELKPYILYSDLLKVDESNIDTSKYFRTILAIFGDLALDDYESLFEKSKFLNSDAGKSFFFEQLKGKEIQKRPAWIIDRVFNPEEIKIQKENSFVFDSISEESSFIFETLSENEFVKFEDKSIAKNEFTKKYIDMDIIDRKELLRCAIQKKDFMNVELFRLFGPLNELIGKDIFEKEECSKYGGCRMFLCNHYRGNTNQDNDYDDEEVNFDVNEEDEEEYDWFDGKCEVCGEKILKRNYALRIPNVFGSWYGCFCSIRCVEKNIDEFLDNPTVNGNVLVNDLDFSSRLMKDKLESIVLKMMEVGIYDYPQE